MTIEQTLERIAAAVEALAEDSRKMIGCPAVAASPPAVGGTGTERTATDTAPAAPATPRGRGRPPGSTAAATAAKEAAAAPAPVEADPFAAPVAAVPAVTEGDVRLALQALKDRVGSVTPVFKLLRDIGGVDTLPALPADKYVAIIAAAKKL